MAAALLWLRRLLFNSVEIVRRHKVQSYRIDKCQCEDRSHLEKGELTDQYQLHATTDFDVVAGPRSRNRRSNHDDQTNDKQDCARVQEGQRCLPCEELKVSRLTLPITCRSAQKISNFG
jgi:hypothetical protein